MTNPPTKTQEAQPEKTQTKIPDPFGIERDSVACVRLLEDRQYRQMLIEFDEKPSDEVRKVLTQASFRWSPENKVWHTPIPQEASWTIRAKAQEVFAQVVAMIREKKNLGQTL